VVKARTAAAQLVACGHVRINGVREKSPGHAVKAGDVVTVGLDNSVRVLKVTGFSERRGDAAAARVLYEDLQNNKEGLCAQGWRRSLKPAVCGPLLPLRQRTACATQTPEN